MNGSEAAFQLFLEYWDDSITHIESMKVMLLNRASRVLGIADLSTGGTNGCLVDLKVVFQYAIKLMHHQLSWHTTTLVGTLSQVKLMDIPLLDHLILTPEDAYFSMADEGFI